ncbi:MAG: transposase [Rhodothermaceae bacterium]|nr:transposase [Rhodothermaceae bacterium]
MCGEPRISRRRWVVERTFGSLKRWFGEYANWKDCRRYIQST